ncbi:MAG: DUF1211 domain-containing protein, partial [Candidatus Saganbacteria bacterium]|nr:DUF1211 domain-containing protein [Candidatus Saganbacteria bacterium]
HDLLFDQTHKFYNYFLSFMLLAVFWIVHHRQFHYIKRIDHLTLLVNILILMFVALVPFSASIIGDYPFDFAAHLVFSANLFVLGLLFSFNWLHATSKHRLVDADLEQKTITSGIRRSLVAPVVCLLAVVVAMFNPVFSGWIYLLIPLVFMHPVFRY